MLSPEQEAEIRRIVRDELATIQHLQVETLGAKRVYAALYRNDLAPSDVTTWRGEQGPPDAPQTIPDDRSERTLAPAPGSRSTQVPPSSQ